MCNKGSRVSYVVCQTKTGSSDQINSFIDSLQNAPSPLLEDDSFNSLQNWSTKAGTEEMDRKRKESKNRRYVVANFKNYEQAYEKVCSVCGCCC
mmetsp:Transcript_6066/g.9326  ORF Transcript_6066/g.9326 Transcript_6066/m.9326 type:complete len:94 (+) Transcript_6066:1582-1863(+)